MRYQLSIYLNNPNEACRKIVEASDYTDALRLCREWGIELATAGRRVAHKGVCAAASVEAAGAIARALGGVR